MIHLCLEVLHEVIDIQIISAAHDLEILVSYVQCIQPWYRGTSDRLVPEVFDLGRIEIG